MFTWGAQGSAAGRAHALSGKGEELRGLLTMDIIWQNLDESLAGPVYLSRKARLDIFMVTLHSYYTRARTVSISDPQRPV